MDFASRSWNPVNGTAQNGGSSNSIKLTTGASSTTGFYVGLQITLTGGPGSGDVRNIIAYDGSTKIATVDSNFSATPTSATTYSIKAFNKMYQYRDEFIGTLKTNIEKVLARRPSEIRVAEIDTKIKSLKDELKNLVRLNSRKAIDEAVYTEEYARISEELEIARNEKSKFDNYEAVRCKFKNRMDEIVQVINERQEFLKEFDEGLFNALVERVVTISPVHFKFELKSGMVIEEKTK